MKKTGSSRLRSPKLGKIILGVCALALVLTLGACSLNSAKITSNEPIKIGLSAPMTGEAASYGEAILGGAQLAVKEINDGGGINGRKIDLIVEDDQCSKEGANSISKLVNFDKVDVIVGPLCSAAAGPGIPIAQTAGIPTIISASAPDLTKIGDYIFRNYPSDSLQGKFTAEYIYNTLGKKKVAVIYVQNDWGEGLQKVFGARFKELGGEIVFNEGITQETKDLRTTITKLKAANPEAVYFPVYPANAIAGFKQLKELGISVPIIGGDDCNDSEILKVKEANGVLFALNKMNTPDSFLNRVKEVTGKETDAYTPFTYDAVKIFAAVIGKVGTDKKAIRDELVKTVYKESVGVPIVEFDQDRNLKSAEYQMLVIKDGKAIEYKK